MSSMPPVVTYLQLDIIFDFVLKSIYVIITQYGVHDVCLCPKFKMLCFSNLFELYGLDKQLPLPFNALITMCITMPQWNVKKHRNAL